MLKRVHSYIAWYPALWTAQSALHFTPWQTYSFQHHCDFSGKHSAMLQLLHEDYSFRYPPLSCDTCCLFQGVYVTYVYEGGPAHQAGLQVHDKLLQVSDFTMLNIFKLQYVFIVLQQGLSNWILNSSSTQ